MFFCFKHWSKQPSAQTERQQKRPTFIKKRLSANRLKINTANRTICLSSHPPAWIYRKHLSKWNVIPQMNLLTSHLHSCQSVSRSKSFYGAFRCCYCPSCLKKPGFHYATSSNYQVLSLTYTGIIRLMKGSIKLISTHTLLLLALCQPQNCLLCYGSSNLLQQLVTNVALCG